MLDVQERNQFRKALESGGIENMDTVSTRNNVRACGNGDSKPLAVCGCMIVKVGFLHWVAISDNPENEQEHFIAHFRTRKQAEEYAYSRREEQF